MTRAPAGQSTQTPCLLCQSASDSSGRARRLRRRRAMSGSTQLALYFSIRCTRRRRDRQLAVDGAGEGVDEVRPGRVVEPERRAAFAAKAPLGRGDLAGLVLVVVDLGAVEPEMLLALHLQRGRVGAEIDGEAAAAGLSCGRWSNSRAGRARACGSRRRILPRRSGTSHAASSACLFLLETKDVKSGDPLPCSHSALARAPPASHG